MTFFNESIPNCVPEYYREQQEKHDHLYDLSMQRRAGYLANQGKLNVAAQSGLPILDYGGYGTCWECPDADHDTMTSDADDFCTVICRNPACPEHQKHQAEEAS